MNCSDIVALITGGASGLGAACAVNLAGRGARIIMVDMDVARGSALAADIGAGAIFCAADITDSAAVEAVLDTASQRFGALHAVINCAGIAPPARVFSRRGPMDIDAFARVVQINLVGCMNVIRLAVPHMIVNPENADGERGVVINTASIAAFEGQIGQAAYSASKAGVVGLTLPLARELAQHGIRVVSVAPGLFDTPMMAGLPEKVRGELADGVPMPRRLGRPAEFAALVAHIIANAMLNGTTIRLDGALRMGA